MAVDPTVLKEKAQQFLETYTKDVNSAGYSNQTPPEHPAQRKELPNFSQLLNQLLSRTKDVQQRFL